MNSEKTTKLYKAYKYRIYPTGIQEAYFWECFHAARFVWNKMLFDSMESKRLTGKGKMPTPASYKADHPWLKSADSFALCNTQLDLKQAYAEFFKQDRFHYSDRVVARAKRQGRELTFYDFEKHPKFKSKKASNWHSYTTNNQDSTVAVVDGKYIKLPKAGLVRCKVHRQIPEGHKIKAATISMSATGKFYVSVLTEIETVIKPVESCNVIGLDFSMSELYVDHNGNEPGFPRYYRNMQAKLAKEQRKLSRMQKGSNNYNKQKRRISRIHEKIANQRKDFHHKLSNQITNDYDTVCVEDLNMKAMSQCLSFGKSVHDNGWGFFSSMLEYKQRWKGHHYVEVERNYPSSKLCNVCGLLNNKLELSDREWTCEGCNTYHKRDHNAATNIRNRGIAILADTA